MLIWLPSQSHKPCPHNESKCVYIPPLALNDNKDCYCGLEKTDCEACSLSSGNFMTLISENVKHGHIVKV